MIADGHYVDGSWLLTVHIDELDIDRQVRVQGDWSVGEVLTYLTDGLPLPTLRPIKPNEISLRTGTPRPGWSEHCLWWPSRCRWLMQKRLSLNQYGLQADAVLRFVPVYGRLRVQLPDLQIRSFVDVNYTEPVFRLTVGICRNLNIRHPEELSLAHPFTTADLKHSRFVATAVDRRQHMVGTINKRGTFQRSATVSTTHSHTKHLVPQNKTENKENDTNVPNTDDVARRSSISSQRLFGPPRIVDKRCNIRVSTNWNQILRCPSPGSSHMNVYPGSMHTLAFEFRSLEDPSLASSPLIGVEEACIKGLLVHSANFINRLHLNSKWLDSAKSLMEQGIDMRPTIEVQPPDLPLENGTDMHKLSTTTNIQSEDSVDSPALVLRFKYGSFYDLNQKYDAVRINQLYEQAKWSLLSEVLETTDDEACLFAALQAHVEIATERESKEKARLSLTTSVDGYDRSDSGKQEDIYVNAGQPVCLSGETKNRDTSPIGGYLRHQQAPKLTQSRPISMIELESQIDAMLDDLSTIDKEDLISISGYHRSRSKRRIARSPCRSVHAPTTTDADPGPPQLKNYIKICKPRRFGLKMFRRLFIAVDGLKLLVYKNEADYTSKSEAAEVVYLPGCEVQPDLCLTSERFGIRMFVPVSRTNLPLSAAFNLGSIDDNGAQTEEEMGVGGRLRRRASLLSLTSLSHFGLQTTVGSSGGLCGPSAAVLGLVNEILFRLPDADSYADWLAYLRLATALPGSGLPTGDDQPDWNGSAPTGSKILSRTIFDAERRAIFSLVRLISPNPTNADSVDSSVQVTALRTRLDQRFADFVPLRLGLTKHLFKALDFTRSRDQTDSSTGLRTATLSSDAKPPVHTTATIQSSTKANVVRRVCIAYSRIHELTSIQAKLKYISAWEQMPHHGIAFFPARVEVTLPLHALLGEDATNRSGVRGGVPWLNRPLGGGNITVSSSRRVEAVGIGPTRVFRFDLPTGEIMASWRMSAIHGWHINRELGELVLLLSPPLPSVPRSPSPQSKPKESQRSVSPIPVATSAAGRVIIRPVGVSVRVIAEFLGGYAFLGLRAPDKNQELDESVFYKLIGSPFPLTQNNLFRS